MDIIGTLPNGVKAFVGSPTGSTTKTDPSVPSSPGNPSVPVTGMSSANTKIAPSAPTASPMNPLPVSTTTLSNANKINQIPGIVNTTNNLSKTGISTDINGNAQYANGTLVPTPDTAPAPNPNPAPNSATTTTGGYVGDVYYAPGATLPLDANGKPQQTTETSPADNQIMQSLNAQKAQTDATTASIIDNITAQYSQLIQQQQQANQGSQATTNNALLMGGVTGQGSSAQFAPISSVGIMQAQVSYGIQKIADLDNKEQTAILAAQQAGQQADFQLQDKINAQISKIRDDKVAAATKLNDQIAAQNQKLADEKLQANKDNAVASLYQSGITDPATILSTLKSKGLNLTADEVGKAVQNITAQTQNQKDINAIALEAAKNGASADVLAKINAAPNSQQALIAAGSSLADTLGTQIKQAQLQKLQLDNAKAIKDAQDNNSDKVPIANEVTGNTVNIPTDVAPYVNTASNGNMYADLSAIQGTAAEKKKIVDEAQAVGLKVIINKNTAADLVNIKDANAKLDTIAGIFDGIAQPNWLARDLGGLGLTKLAALAETNPQKAAAGSLESVGLDMLKAISGVQGFRGNSTVVQQITDHLPKVTDTKDTVNQKIAYIRQLISDREDAAVGRSNIPSTQGQIIEYNGKQYQTDSDGNFDPAKPLTNAGSGATNAQVKAYQTTIQPMQPISFNATPLEKLNLQSAASIPENLQVKIGAGAAVKNNNPGNLRNVDGSWQKFSTPEDGFKALTGYLTRAITGASSIYKPTQTLYQFFAKYAPSSDSNDPKGYAESIAKKLGVSPDTKIGTLNVIDWAKQIAAHESNTKFG